MQCFAQARSKSVAEPEALRMSLVFEPKYPPLPLPGQERVKREGSKMFKPFGEKRGSNPTHTWTKGEVPLSSLLLSDPMERSFLWTVPALSSFIDVRCKNRSLPPFPYPMPAIENVMHKQTTMRQFISAFPVISLFFFFFFLISAVQF